MKIDRLFLVLAVLLAIALGFHRASGQEPDCQTSFAPGTILCTVNVNPALNTTMGPLNPYYNHQGIVSSDGQFVIEGQSGPPYAPPGGAVVKTPMAEFLARDYFVWRFDQVYSEIGRRAALYAEAMIGSPYGPYASLGPQRVRELVSHLLGRVPIQSCVSVCRRAEEQATGWALWGWVHPSDIVWHGRLLRGPYPVKIGPQQLPATPPQPMEVTP
jgi:hypothetical protein